MHKVRLKTGHFKKEEPGSKSQNCRRAEYPLRGRLPRDTQENFFPFMTMGYNIDKIAKPGTMAIDEQRGLPALGDAVWPPARLKKEKKKQQSPK